MYVFRQRVQRCRADLDGLRRRHRGPASGHAGCPAAPLAPPRRAHAGVIAVYWYSQTGQLRECLEHFLEPLVAAGCEVRWIEVTPCDDFPFPWSLGRFFGVFAQAADAESTVDICVGDRGRDVGDD